MVDYYIKENNAYFLKKSLTGQTYVDENVKNVTLVRKGSDLGIFLIILDHTLLNKKAYEKIEENIGEIINHLIENYKHYNRSYTFSLTKFFEKNMYNKDLEGLELTLSNLMY